MKTPKPHQQDLLDRTVGVKRVPLLWEMRLGKTPWTVWWCERFRPRKVLVLCPMSTVYDAWMKELDDLKVPAVAMTGSTADKMKAWDSNPNARWYVTNHEAVFAREGRKCIPSALCEQPWDAVIVDEADRLKNPASKLYKTLMLYQPPIRAILSGTINPESDADFFGPFSWLYGHFMGFKNFWTWRNEHMQPDPAGYGWLMPTKTRKAIRAYVAERSYILTRKQAGIGSELIRERRSVDLPGKVRRAYDALVKDMERRRPDGTYETHKNALELATRLSQICGGATGDDLENYAKADELIDVLTGDLRTDQVVVWFRYNAEIAHVRRRIAEKKAAISTSAMTGTLNAEQRRDAILAFRSGKKRVLLIQSAVGQYGIDLSVSNTAIIYSWYWSGKINSQMQDRIQHMDKSVPVMLLSLPVRHSIDEDAIRAVGDKRLNSVTFAENWFRNRKEVQ